ncbi:hypothetical protein ACFQ9X_32075 [Catenulispora yoronensis]
MLPRAMPVASGAEAIKASAACSAAVSVPAGAGIAAIRHSASASVFAWSTSASAASRSAGVSSSSIPRVFIPRLCTCIACIFFRAASDRSVNPAFWGAVAASLSSIRLRTPVILFSAVSIMAMTIRRSIAWRAWSSAANWRSSFRNAWCRMMSFSLAVTARSIRLVTVAASAFAACSGLRSRCNRPSGGSRCPACPRPS